MNMLNKLKTMNYYEIANTSLSDLLGDKTLKDGAIVTPTTKHSQSRKNLVIMKSIMGMKKD